MERPRILSVLGKKANSWLNCHDVIPDDQKELGLDKPTYWYWISLLKQAMSITDMAYEGLPREEKLHQTDLSLTQMALVARLAQKQEPPKGANIEKILETNQQRVDNIVLERFGGDLRRGALVRNLADLRAQSLLDDQRWDTLTQKQRENRRPISIRIKSRKKA